MARPRRCRRICSEPEHVCFTPDGIAAGGAVVLTVDEFETIRLVDHEGLTHQQCAVRMDISRTTATEIYESARTKLADSLVNGKPLLIQGGDYRLCEGGVCSRPCMRSAEISTLRKEEALMRIAVPYENGNVFQHFGHTAQFAIYDVEDGQVLGSAVVPTLGSGHGALAGFLARSRVDAVICGGIGAGAQEALQQAGIQLYGGVQGDAGEAVKALLADELVYDPAARCDHHDHHHGEGHTCGEHGCGEHTCGEHDCGEHSCGGHT